MNDLLALSIRLQDSKLFLLDQTLLPHKQEWLECCEIPQMVAMIQKLQIRGAPAIGLAACLLLALRVEAGRSEEDFREEAEVLRAARPTAVNLMNNIDSLLRAADLDFPSAVIKEAERLFHEDVALCRSLADRGAELILPGEKVLTHCNTGGLATAGVGTALGVIVRAHQQAKDIKVWVDETRPLLQGGRLTAWELGEAGVPYQIICDSMSAMLMARGQVDRIFVGADRIAANGDFANKVGTYQLAVSAHYHNVPFYVVAPNTTVDLSCASGKDIPIEEREASEVKGVSGAFGSCTWAPDLAEVFNPAFDVTPADLVTGWVLDSGVFSRENIQSGCLAGNSVQ